MCSNSNDCQEIHLSSFVVSHLFCLILSILSTQPFRKHVSTTAYEQGPMGGTAVNT